MKKVSNIFLKTIFVYVSGVSYIFENLQMLDFYFFIFKEKPKKIFYVFICHFLNNTILYFQQQYLRKNQMFEQPSYFTLCSSIQIHFPHTFSQGTYDTLPLTVVQLCDLRDAMPSHWLPITFYPTLTYRNTKFPKGWQIS